MSHPTWMLPPSLKPVASLSHLTPGEGWLLPQRGPQKGQLMAYTQLTPIQGVEGRSKEEFVPLPVWDS